MGRKTGKKDPYWTGVLLSAAASFSFLFFLSPLGFFLSWVLAMTIVTVALYILDKLAAKGGRRRASEPLLMVCAIVGGGIGAFLAMVLLPHKRNNGSFWAVNLFSAAMWGILVIWEFVH
jgi:uncharacterized membrane protein YsdA (DUF1294 family)